MFNFGAYGFNVKSVSTWSVIPDHPFQVYYKVRQFNYKVRQNDRTFGYQRDLLVDIWQIY